MCEKLTITKTKATTEYTTTTTNLLRVKNNLKNCTKFYEQLWIENEQENIWWKRTDEEKWKNKNRLTSKKKPITTQPKNNEV